MTPATTSTTSPAQAAPALSPRLPPLESGDHLSREEFERRYDAMPNVKKAELIEGVVYMPAAVRWNQHAAPHADFITWLGVYRAHTPGVRVGDNSSLRLNLDTEPQPDAAMIIQPSHGGQVRLTPDDYVEGGPELAAEVAASSAAIDLNSKLRVYLRNGVREYLVWRVLDGQIDWFVLRGSQYELLPRNAAGLYQSEVFPGLWLDPAALVALDLARVFGVLQQGLASPEHAAFVTKLEQAAASKP